VHQAQNQDVGAGNGRNPWDRGGPPVWAVSASVFGHPRPRRCGKQ
jgi:hypothetical protein